MTLPMILQILALLAFLLACVDVIPPRINMIAFGLAM